MGRVVLPGEMSFENFLSGYNFNQNNPSSLVQSPGIGGGLGGLQPQLIDTAPEFKKFRPYYGRISRIGHI